jgi:CRP-like cAMP-binding protein
MISPELLRRYAFFAGLSRDQITTLAGLAREDILEADEYVFRQGEELDHFYLVLDGGVDILIGVTDRTKASRLSAQLTGDIDTVDIAVSSVQPGEIFGWSGLVPPHCSTASAKATADSRVVSFDCKALMEAFEKDNCFGFLMTQKIAHVIRERLRDIRMESLATVTP